MPIRRAIQNINLSDRESVASPYAVILVLSTGTLYGVSLDSDRPVEVLL